MKTKTLSTLSKEQQELTKLIKQGLESGEGPFADIFGAFNPESFKKGVSEPAMKQFTEEILPQLHEQYIAGNQGLSTARGAAATKARTDLQSKLAALMYQAQQQQGQNRISGLNTLYGKQAVENVVKQPSQGGNALSSILGPLATVAGTALGGFFGGPAGAAAGAAAGNAVGSTGAKSAGWNSGTSGSSWNLQPQVG